MKLSVITYFLERPNINTINNITKSQRRQVTVLTYLNQWFMDINHRSKKVSYKRGVVRNSTIDGLVAYYQGKGYHID